MNKRLLSISDRHDEWLRKESARLDISISGLMRGILEAHIEKQEAKQQIIITPIGGMGKPVECDLKHTNFGHYLERKDVSDETLDRKE